MAKDKFKQLKGSSLTSSFQDMASTVAAIEQQAAKQEPRPETQSPNVTEQVKPTVAAPATERLTHLANPSIPQSVYNMASMYCSRFDNMTRQDWMELAIIEKLNRDGMMSDEEFNTRQTEIRSRLPRGQRKNTKNK